ncbi:MAG: hypothetical protein ACHP7M_02240 [Burkholderiales bacterium]
MSDVRDDSDLADRVGASVGSFFIGHQLLGRCRAARFAAGAWSAAMTSPSS